MPRQPTSYLCADGVPTIRALTSLNVSSNRIKGAEAGKALGNALAANTVLKQLDLSTNYSGAEFANEFAVGLGANGALASLDLSQNNIPESEKGRVKAICKGKKILLAV